MVLRLVKVSRNESEAIITSLVPGVRSRILATAVLLMVKRSSITNVELVISILPVEALTFQLKLIPPINMVRLLISNGPLPVKLISALSPLING